MTRPGTTPATVASALPATQPGPRPVPQPPRPPGIRPAVRHARIRRRHIFLLVSFVLMVAIPAAVSAWYLWFRAADQYASTVGFTVRREEGGSAIELLGGLTQFSSAGSSDTDILYEFLQSQKLVADVDAKLNLRRIWSKADGDPIFSYDGESIEDLVKYWNRMVRISYDSASGLIEVRVLAFTPEDATRIAQTLFDDSSQMINDLSAVAREDSIRYARHDLNDAVDRLKEARQAITAFRNKNQIVDPKIDVANQSGLLGKLQAQLAESLIAVDLLKDSAKDGDPRMVQAQRRVQVIRDRIAAERDKLGLGNDASDSDVMAGMVSKYESLAVDQEFAEKTYVAALASYDAALADARRKSRYLAAYAQPTHAETSRFPQRLTLESTATLFLFLAWVMTVLVAYAIKDRR
jgi:capsular polysaccharide transport system permease protein